MTDATAPTRPTLPVVSTPPAGAGGASSTPSINDRLRAALSRLVEVAAWRAQTEAEISRRFDAATQDAKRTLADRTRAIEGEFRTRLAEVEGEINQTSRQFEARAKAEAEAAQREYDSSKAGINEKATANEKAARKAMNEARWLAETVYEASENQPQERFDLAATYAKGKLQALQTIREQADAFLIRCRMKPTAALAEPASAAPTAEALPGDTIDDMQVALERQLAESDRLLASLRSMKVPRLFHSLTMPAILLLAMMIAAGVAAWRVDWEWGAIPLLAAGGALIAGVLVAVGLYFTSRSKAFSVYAPLLEAIGVGTVAGQRYLDYAAEIRERERLELAETRDRELRTARERYTPIIEEILQRRDVHLQRIEEKYPALIAALKDRHEEERRALKERADASLADLRRGRDEQLASVQAEFDAATKGSQELQERDWSAMSREWFDSMAWIRGTVTEAKQREAALFLPWSDPTWAKYPPRQELTDIVRFGSLRVDLAAIEGGVPSDERLNDGGAAAFDVPGFLAFPNECSMVITTPPEGRRHAVEAVQNLMLRLLTTLPPGKARFSLIDPIGLGQNFAAFMHLADHLESLVGDRILTDPRHIEQRLVDLTEHMENVIQKYLRNEFRTIAEYNREAGEIAEPYRFVVIADFPTNFNDNAARRLASVLNSGARCGVYTIIITDGRAALPNGISTEDLLQGSIRLRFENGRFIWDDAAMARFPLSLESPPDEDAMTRILHDVGRNAKAASRVEVPFRIIAPTDSQRWTLDSGPTLRAPIGRLGATKLQYLTLGQGVWQHVLIAGKTGSGKSTLLHAMITSLSMWYSPQQVEFYLIDFKKGVEFKTYASLELPHARAVAIESDREFGLSVLQRLDGELRRRGAIFRDLEVQDLAGYRRARPDGPPMPRTLLVIDEFQEFFSEDDKLAQDAALLMDRLVRQGRAFGIHVILGSQTLGGAYSLARATMGQMAVRIALQCSEADSHLILSDENTAARLLSRPGEAIYNDAGGLVDGNSPFQIVWLSDEEREEHLREIHRLATTQGKHPVEPTIVFEGNIPAELDRCAPLRAALDQPSWPAGAAAPSAWLGDAIAIKEPTAAVFRRQAGANLLMVGQQDESALAMMATSIVGLAAQQAPASAKFYLLDGSTPDSPYHGTLASLAGVVPHAVVNVAYRDVPGAMAEISQEVERRRESGDADHPSMYVFIYGLQRFRTLRRAEDDFSFSSSERGPSPEKQLGTILREGSAVGVHVIAWCDTLNNLNRTFDRASLREFDQRVLFQMSANDSSALIDSPVAGRLGARRAFYHSEELGQLEKFRPFALPSEEWLKQVKRLLRGRAAMSS